MSRIQANYHMPSWAGRAHADAIIKACGGTLVAFETLPNGNKDVLVQFESANAMAALSADLGYPPVSTSTGGHDMHPPWITIVKLTGSGLGRVLNGQVGMTFMVDSFGGVGGRCAHVRDYRHHANCADLGRPFQIWTLGPGDFEIIASRSRP